MFPSSNNGNIDPICYSIDHQQAYNNKPFFNDIINHPSSKQEEPIPSPFFHIPSPPFMLYELEFEDNDVSFHQNHDLLLMNQLQQPLRAATCLSQSSTVFNNMADSNANQQIESNNSSSIDQHQHHQQHQHQYQQQQQQRITRKRGSKRDRHSKINTAQGPRDRRMRLSLKVARDFFDLQDKLGFDKASKTVEWLLIQAKHEIKKLSGVLPRMNYSCSFGTKSASSTSECEVVSGFDDAANIGGSTCKGKPSQGLKKEKKGTRPSRKAAFDPLARESREKKRARARERTREKQLSQRIFNESKLCEEVKNHELQHQLSCWSDPLETGEESGTQSHSMNPNSMDFIAPVSSHDQQDQQLCNPEGIIDDESMAKWSPSSIFNHLQNNGITQEHQLTLTDFQSLFCKSWEAYYINQSL